MTLIAINVLLDPDAATVERAQAVNSRLREIYAEGFALDANHAPHVTTGIGPRDHLDQMLAERFDPFTFSPAGAAVYQLGNFGTARKKLRG